MSTQGDAYSSNIQPNRSGLYKGVSYTTCFKRCVHTCGISTPYFSIMSDLFSCVYFLCRSFSKVTPRAKMRGHASCLFKAMLVLSNTMFVLSKNHTFLFKVILVLSKPFLSFQGHACPFIFFLLFSWRRKKPWMMFLSLID